MSIATDSTRASVYPKEGLRNHELLRSREISGPTGYASFGATKRRRIVVGLALLCSDLISASVALFLVDSVFGFPRTETALTGLPVLIGLFWVSGFYSSYGLAPAERLRARLLGTLAFVGAFLVVPEEYFHSEVWVVAASQGVVLFLFGYYAEALARHALIRRKVWGAATVFAGSGPAIEQARLLLSAVPHPPQYPSYWLRIHNPRLDFDWPLRLVRQRLRGTQACSHCAAARLRGSWWSSGWARLPAPTRCRSSRS